VTIADEICYRCGQRHARAAHRWRDDVGEILWKAGAAQGGRL